MNKNFIFDFGWVLVQFEPKYMTRKYIGDPEDCKLVQDVIFDRLYWDKLDRGDISEEEVKEAFRERIPEHLYENACKALDNWYHNLPFIDGMVDLVKEIKAKGGKLYILSNISREFANGYKNVPEINELFSLFDGLVFSAVAGHTKPNADIFEYLLSTYSLDREDTMFIDDSEKNIKGAIAVGIDGYLFDGNAQKLREYIFR